MARHDHRSNAQTRQSPSANALPNNAHAGGQPPAATDSNSGTSETIAPRRSFMQSVSALAIGAWMGTGLELTAVAAAPVTKGSASTTAESALNPESLVKVLFDSLTPEQRTAICFDWDHKDDRGLLRTHVSNNWNVTDEELAVGGKFYSSDQQDLIREIFLGLYHPDYHERILKQLQDDAGGYGKSQTIALFGTPGSEKFQFLMTGRHLTIRCDGNTAEHVAFGGPIFYGHAASDFNEPKDHPGNVFWPQAQTANALFQMLDGKQREQALVLKAPGEADVGFRGNKLPVSGIRVGDLSADQQAHAQKTLQALIEPYRDSDRAEALAALRVQGGLENCRLSFFRQAANGQSLDIGDDGVWDVWRLEGPAFVWHYRGAPHVHVWVNVADDPSVALNARG